MAANEERARTEAQRLLVTLVFEDVERFRALLRITRLLQIDFGSLES